MDGGNIESTLRIFNDQIWDNYIYTANRRAHDAVYYVCTFHKSKPCPARGILKGNVFNLKIKHNHKPNLKDIKERSFKRDLFRAVTTSADNYRKIYDTIRLKHIEAAVSVTFARVESLMFKWRQKFCPPAVHSLLAYVNILGGDDWKHLLVYAGGEMTISLTISIDNSKSIVFLNPSFVREIAVTGCFFIDATFKVVPALNNLHQLMTIMSKKFNHALPIIWVLMTNRTIPAYKSVFREIKRLIPEFQIEACVTDYEKALQRALQEEFIGVNNSGCLFHHNQAVVKNVSRFGLNGYLEENENARHFISLLLSLPLLPANQIENAYAEMRLSLEDETERVLNRFLQYYENQWFRIVTPQVFSVYNLINRTNNYVESYHKSLKEKFGIHPTIWNFTKALIKLQEGLHVDLQSLRQGYVLSRLPKATTVMEKRLLINAWSMLNETNGFTCLEFLEHVVNFKSNTLEAYTSLYGSD